MAWCCPRCGMRVPGSPTTNSCWRCYPELAPKGYISKKKATQCSDVGYRKKVIISERYYGESVLKGEYDETDIIEAISNGTYYGDWDDIPGFK